MKLLEEPEGLVHDQAVLKGSDAAPVQEGTTTQDNGSLTSVERPVEVARVGDCLVSNAQR